LHHDTLFVFHKNICLTEKHASTQLDQHNLGPTVFRRKFCQIPRASLQNSAAYPGKSKNHANSAAHLGLPFES